MKSKIEALTDLDALFSTYWPKPLGSALLSDLPKRTNHLQLWAALLSVCALKVCPRAPQLLQLKKRSILGDLLGWSRAELGEAAEQCLESRASSPVRSQVPPAPAKAGSLKSSRRTQTLYQYDESRSLTPLYNTKDTGLQQRVKVAGEM